MLCLTRHMRSVFFFLLSTTGEIPTLMMCRKQQTHYDSSNLDLPSLFQFVILSLCPNKIDKSISRDSLPTTISLQTSTASLISQWEFHTLELIHKHMSTTPFNLHAENFILAKTSAIHTSQHIRGFQGSHPLMGSKNRTRTFDLVDMDN